MPCCETTSCKINLSSHSISEKATEMSSHDVYSFPNRSRSANLLMTPTDLYSATTLGGKKLMAIWDRNTIISHRTISPISQKVPGRDLQNGLSSSKAYFCPETMARTVGN